MGEILYRPKEESDHRNIELDNDPFLNLEVTKNSFLQQRVGHENSIRWIEEYITQVHGRQRFHACIIERVRGFRRLRRQVGKDKDLTNRKMCDGAATASVPFILNTIHEIAIDDFGSGIAPLKNMVELPFSKVKVDMDIIKGIDYSEIKQDSRSGWWLDVGPTT